METYETTPASVHDSNVIAPLIEESDKDQRMYLDAGYEGKEQVVKDAGMRPLICESIGIVRAKANFALTCLVYNIFRYVQINKYQPQLIGV